MVKMISRQWSNKEHSLRLNQYLTKKFNLESNSDSSSSGESRRSSSSEESSGSSSSEWETLNYCCSNDHSVKIKHELPADYSSLGIFCAKCSKEIEVEEGFHHCKDDQCKLDYHLHCLEPIPPVNDLVEEVDLSKLILVLKTNVSKVDIYTVNEANINDEVSSSES